MLRLKQVEEIANNPEPQRAGDAPPPAPPQPASQAMAAFRRVFTDEQYELLLALGEQPEEYQQVMESLLDDLQPRCGMERELVEHIAQTFWRMRRSQRMQDGLALKRLQRKMDVEEATTAIRTTQAFDLLEPFERLQKALARRGQTPTPAEIDEFVEARRANPSPETQEFLAFLESLKQPMDRNQRNAALRKARNDLRRIMEPYANLAWQTSRQSEKVRWSANMAALMAPDDDNADLVQDLEDLQLRRLWRLTNTFAKVRQGEFRKKKKTNKANILLKTKGRGTKCPTKMQKFPGIEGNDSENL